MERKKGEIMEDKIFISGMFIKEKEFDNGGSVLNVGIKLDELMSNLSKHKKPNGYVNITISKTRNPKEDAQTTHYATLNTFEPKEVQKESEEKQVDSPEDEYPF